MRPLLLCMLLLAGAVASSLSARPAGTPEVVRRDWYFRESLLAIRDWETILARWETQTPADERTPTLPVPAGGDAILWPNPIPLPLLPAEDAGVKLSVRLENARVLIERAIPGRAPERRDFALSEIVPAYKHPGGGGKDQWYHAYTRRFDGLTTFRARPAPFVLELPTPQDLRPGDSTLRVGLRSLANQPLVVALRLRSLSPAANSQVAETRGETTVEPFEAAAVALPVRLTQPGGGLLILELDAEDEHYWLPIFTYVEDVPDVLTGIRQILADTPDEGAARKFAGLRERAAQGPAALGTGWRALFAEASALRDALLLRRLSFQTLLFVKRKPYFSEQPYMDAHHLFNRPGGAIYRLSPVGPEGIVTPVVDSLGEGIYRDLCLSWDATRLLFSFGNGSDTWNGGQSYHLYEVGVDGSGLRQITTGPKNDCEPFYLPSGEIGFTSDRPEHFVMCGGDRHAANLHVMNPDGSGLRCISANLFNDFSPSVLPDGRILYSRWEYNERSVTSLHKLFTLLPDGSEVTPFYGDATVRPNVTMFPRAVPGSSRVMALFTAHHGQTHGPIGLIDPRVGLDGPEPITLLTPNVPVTGEKAEDSRFGWYSDPVPLSETTYLCSYTPTVLPWLETSWALYVGDRHGNLALVTRDPAISCAEPVPVLPRPRPPVLASVSRPAAPAEPEGTFLLLDVSRNLPGVARGTVRFLRVVEDIPRVGVPHGGVVVTAATSIYTVKRILGTVPVETDGSAHFTVPADRNVYFEALDAQQREVQRMRSVICLRPGERRTCAGCHEPRNTAPPNLRAQAFRRPPSRPSPPPWGTRILSYLRDIQPILNARCVSCHAFDRPANKVILTDDLTDQFSIGYQEMIPYLSAANAMRWDHPDDVLPRPPYTYGSRISRLTRLLEAGHHGVQLSEAEWQRLFAWIDANGVYYDRYESVYPDRRLFSPPVRQAVEGVYARRCASCHGAQDDRNDGRQNTWWCSLNRRDVTLSRMLRAPLARAAGGWGRCEGTVFASTDDADYRTLLAALTRVRDTLAQQPREDLLSLRDTDAERQAVTLPNPPPGRPAVPEPPLEGDWAYLSDLPWESARAGWTANNDLLPRRGLDVEDAPLRLQGRVYRKGIGTHAPSEILYRLDGRYSRFHAVVGGAEGGGTVVFQVWADDRLLFDSGVLRGLGETKRVDVPLSGARRLRLVVTDAGDGYIHDMANWAEARVRKAAGQISTR